MYEVIKNKKIGKLTVIGYSHTNNVSRYYICKCECGMETVAEYTDLKAGKVLKCSLCK